MAIDPTKLEAVTLQAERDAPLARPHLVVGSA